MEATLVGISRRCGNDVASQKSNLDNTQAANAEKYARVGPDTAKTDPH